MRNPQSRITSQLYRLILQCASSFVPQAQRQEWLREWTSELWYVLQATCEMEGSSLRSHLEISGFCRGAFSDAMTIRWHHQPRILGLGNPIHCLMALFLLAVTSFSIAFFLPRARTALSLSSYRDARSLVLISSNGYTEASSPSIPLSQYLDWRKHAQHLFTDIAFYQILKKPVHIGRYETAEFAIARASSNLFDLLSISPADESLEPAAPPENGRYTAKVILGENTWRTYFHGDTHVLGRTLFVAGREATIAGILSQNDWRLPGHPDIWLLEEDRQIAQLSSHTRGFVLAHLQPSLTHRRSGEDIYGNWHMSVAYAEGGWQRFDCTSLVYRSRQPFLRFLFAMLLAAMALPATTSLPLGEYAINGHGQSRKIRLRRWIFLGAKLLFILPTVYFVALDIAYAKALTPEPTSAFMQGAISFCVCLFMFRWVLKDQRRRCPVCLETLQNPARVGEPSRNFLSWNGTELICVGGHGFLHVPEISTSWFSTQRWLYLDPSWRSLFEQSATTALYL